MCKYHRFENESEDELIYRICSDKELIGSWNDVADILNELLDYKYSESKYRKQFQAFSKMFNANCNKLINSEEIEDLNNKIRELEQKKIQYRDERNAWNKQNYTSARVSQKLDYLSEKLQEIGKINFPSAETKYYPSKSNDDMLILLTDWHIGATFDNEFGKFNTEIAEQRISQLLKEVIDIRDRHYCRNCYIAICGDMISGSIHKSIQVTNRENVIDQIKYATNLLINFLVEISKNFEYIYVTDVVGNHSRIDKKDDALNDERLDSLITWVASMTLKHIKNIIFDDDKIDSSISYVTIKGKNYYFVHGDYDKFDKNGISNLCMYVHDIPYAICMGHMHTCAVDEVNGVKMIRGGSLCGSGDEFTVKKRLNGKPSQMVCVCDNNGIKAYYPIEFNI